MSKNYYVSGSHNITCDRCSKKIKAHEAKHEWTGFIVCGDCYETRHPQDFVKAHSDKISVPFVRPIPEYVFTVVPYNLYWDAPYTSAGYIEGDDNL